MEIKYAVVRVTPKEGLTRITMTQEMMEEFENRDFKVILTYDNRLFVIPDSMKFKNDNIRYSTKRTREQDFNRVNIPVEIRREFKVGRKYKINMYINNVVEVLDHAQ